MTESNRVEPVMETSSSSHVHTTVIEADNNVELARPVTSEDIISWSIHGTNDDVIIDRIEHSPNVFHLSALEEIHLHDAGVSSGVIRAMKVTAN